MISPKRMLVVEDAGVRNNYGLKGEPVHVIFAVGRVLVDVADPTLLVPGSDEEESCYRTDETGLWARLLKVINPDTGQELWPDEVVRDAPNHRYGLWLKFARLAPYTGQPTRTRVFILTVPSDGPATIKEE